MSVDATAQFFNYRGPVKQAKDRAVKAWGFDHGNQVPFPNLSSIGAGVANTEVLARITLAQYSKIAKVAFSFDSIDSINGDESFNIVVGTGAYGGSGAFATGHYTLSGSPTDSDTNTYTIGGHAVHTNQATANSLAEQAAADAASINADATVGALVYAEAVAAVIYITSLAAGTAGNSITTTGTSSAGDTVTAGQAHLAGGAAATAITLPTPDQFLTTGTYGPYAADGDALFSPDVAFNAQNFPGISLDDGGSAVFAPPNNPLIVTSSGFPLPIWDAIYPPGMIITVRATTNAGAGSIVNPSCTLYLVPIDVNVTDNNGVPLVDW